MKIFITGATGFIGKNLTRRLLSSGHNVYALCRDKNKLLDIKSQNLFLLTGDIEDTDGYKQVFEKGIDIVYHLAAIPGQKWIFRKKDYHQINVRSTARLLAACHGRVKRFIFASSINALPEIYETDQEDYGRSKQEAEKIVESYKDKGLEIVILRPAVVYGPGDTKGMMLKLLQLVKKGKFHIIGTGKNVIPLVHVDDLVDAFISAQKAKNGSLSEIIGPENLSFEKITEIISNSFAVPAPKLKIPVWMARIAAFLSENIATLLKVEPLVSHHRVNMVIRHQALSSEKAHRDLDYQAKIKFIDGIASTINWYKQNGYL